VRPNPRCNTAEYFGAYKAEHALLADKFLEGDGESLRQLLNDHLTETERRLCVAFSETQSTRNSA
jgi:hypothetical protein